MSYYISMLLKDCLFLDLATRQGPKTRYTSNQFAREPRFWFLMSTPSNPEIFYQYHLLYEEAMRWLSCKLSRNRDSPFSSYQERPSRINLCIVG